MYNILIEFYSSFYFFSNIYILFAGFSVLMLEFLQNYGIVIAFYLTVVLLIYFNRKKFHFEGKIIAMYKTKLGLKTMKRLADRHPKLIKFLGTTGIYVGFLGMFFILYMVFLGLHQLIFRPDAPPLFTPVLPGISIPGSPITLPLLEGLIALFIVVVIHEFSHGVVSKAYKIPIKSSGFVMIGPLPGAFVEPDEKKLQKSSRKIQMSIFAAGPFSNILLAALIIAMVIGAGAITSNMYESSGILITGFTDETEIQPEGRLEGLEEGEIIYSVNNESVRSVFNLIGALQNSSPGDIVFLETSLGEKEITLSSHPDNESQAYLGVFLEHSVTPREEAGYVFPEPVRNAWFWLFGNPFSLTFDGNLGLFGWIFVLSLGIGIVNLLPAGPVDGGKMYLLVLEKYLRKSLAKRIWVATLQVLLVIVAILIFVPIFMALFF